MTERPVFPAPFKKNFLRIIRLVWGGIWIGIILLIIGLVYGDPVLIILDADGNASQDSLASALDAKYSQINDADVTQALAAKIREKAASTVANEKGEKNVTLTRAELSEILAPTGLEEVNSAAFEQIVSDLK